MSRYIGVLILCALATCSVLRSEKQVVSDDIKIAEADYQEDVAPTNFTKVQTKTILIGDDENLNKVSYEGYQLWKVATDSSKKVKIIGDLKQRDDIKTWGGNRSNIDILVHPEKLGKVGANLRSHLIGYEVIIDDLQKVIDEENPKHDDEDEEFQHRYGHRMTFTSYHRLADIHNYLDYLAETYPSFCKVQVIGSSIEGRPLKLLKISNGNPGNKAVWIDGGTHAREWITPATVSYIIEHLVHNIESESKALQNLDYYVLPVVNPDGYEYSHTRDRLWRKNRARGGSHCGGTDLNRNYGYKWGGKGSGKNPCQDIYAGTSPFSEPETAAIKTFITSTRANWKASISYHSYGQYILFPWGYDRLITVDNKDLQSVAQKAANAIKQTTGSSYTFGPAGATLYPASGGSDDWAKGAVGMKYTYTIELRDNGRYGFVLPASYIVPTAKEGLAALRVIAEAAAAA